jgi:catechol 2,3-dioxygenase-like lactoylglutathione lyase family enzyme
MRARDIVIWSASLSYTDRDASLALYRDILGFDVRNETGSNGIAVIMVGPVKQSRMTIVLEPPPADVGITLATTDLLGVFEHLEGSGVEVAQEPIVRSNGLRDCAFFDPAGNLIRINELQ